MKQATDVQCHIYACVITTFDMDCFKDKVIGHIFRFSHGHFSNFIKRQASSSNTKYTTEWPILCFCIM